MNVVAVMFDNKKKVSYFINKKLKLKKNLTVIVDSDRGYLFGTVVDIIDDVNGFDLDSLYDVVRISTKRDYLHHLDNKKDEIEAIKKCSELIKKYELTMTIIDANYNFDRSQLLYRFVADERVDFRNLAKDLGSIFKTRIELRQIGIRDKAKEVGGFGPCGRLLCCSSFLTSFDSISINMAKNQNLLLNPSKINGVCGRLLCCLKYENDDYVGLKNKESKNLFKDVELEDE